MNRFWLICFLFLVSLISGSATLVIYFHFYPGDPPPVSQPIAVAIPTLTPSPSPTVAPISPALDQLVSAALSGTTGDYGIVVKNLSTGETYSRNAAQSFAAGSLYKLWVMAVAYRQVESGALSLDAQLSQNVVDLNSEFGIASDEAELTSGVVSYTVAEALTQMITVSDNYSAMLLTDKVGLPAVTSFLKSLNLTGSQVGVRKDPPITTAADVAAFFDYLYQGKLAHANSTAAMLSLLKEQHINDKLPLYLPDDLVIAHKTGEIDNFTHDAGIVYTPTGNYVIVVLSQTDSPPLAEKRISAISLAVYNYFTK